MNITAPLRSSLEPLPRTSPQGLGELSEQQD